MIDSFIFKQSLPIPINFGNFSMNGFMNFLVPFLYGLGIFALVGAFVWFIISHIRNKNIYTSPIRIIKLLENGSHKELNGLKGGKLKNNLGIITFIIKQPYKLKKIDLGYIPDFSKADGDGRLVFLTIGDGMVLQQLDVKIHTKEKIIIPYTNEEIIRIKNEIINAIDSDPLYKDCDKDQKEQLVIKYLNERILNDPRTITKDLVIKPIPTDTKQVTINNLQKWRFVLGKEKLTVFTIAVGGFIVMVIAHLISLYIQTKIKCPTAP